MTDLAAIRERIEVLAVLSKGYRPLGMHDGLERARLSTLCDAIDELAALLADTPSVEPVGPAESFDVEMLAATYESYPWPTLPHGKSRPRDLAEYVVAEYGLVTPAPRRLLPTQASDSKEKP